MTLTRLQVSIPASPATNTAEGHGEGISWNNKTYYYRSDKEIPRDKVVYLKWEGNYAGRQIGEKEWIIVVWDKEGFLLLEHLHYDVRGAMSKFRGKSAEQAIKIVTDLNATQNAMSYLGLKETCHLCGKPVVKECNFQPSDECYECYVNTKKAHVRKC